MVERPRGGVVGNGAVAGVASSHGSGSGGASVGADAASEVVKGVANSHGSMSGWASVGTDAASVMVI